MFHPEAEKSFNSAAFEIVSLVEESNDINYAQAPLKGSLANKRSIDMSDKLADVPAIQSVVNYNGVTESSFEIYKGKRIGLGDVNYKKFLNLISKIYKQKGIYEKGSLEFVKKCSFQWILNTYKNKQASSDYCTYLFSEINNSLKDYRLSFEILHLEIEKPFKLGNVEFDFLTPEYFDDYEQRMKKEKPGHDVSLLREKYEGKVYASYAVKAIERGKAEEVAINECYLAMDVLKLFTPTIKLPDYEISFEIDRRVNIHHTTEFIVRDPDDKLDFTINFSSRQQPYKFATFQIDAVKNSSGNFEYLICLQERNELQKLIINSLAKFSEAIINKNIHKRIVDLFTIWESLLLKDSTTPIISTVSLYGSKLLRTGIDKRKEFINFMKEMYEIRSSMIHHAKAKELDLTKVAIFQTDTVNLMERLIILSKKHLTKDSLIQEIDDAIHKAF